jgi:hypothetical protein
MLWAIDTNLSGPFVSLNYDQFVRHNYGKDVRFLTEEENTNYKKAFDSYSKTSKNNSVDEGFKLYKAMGE